MADKYVYFPLIDQYQMDLTCVLDFPSGRGRIAESIYNRYKGRITTMCCCDSNEKAITFCEQRFSGFDGFVGKVNKLGADKVLPLPFDNSQFTLVYSWDAMVHFSLQWLDFYFSEFSRILRSGGMCMIHHSNLASPEHSMINKNEEFMLNPHGRSNVSADDIARIAHKYGFEILEQRLVDWGDEAFFKNLDCISIMRKS